MISLLSLILSLEPYYKVLQRILNESHISQDITFESMKVTKYLCFIEDELGLEGIGHNKVLHITIKYKDKDYMIVKVLNDIGSSFNIVLKCILERLSVEVSRMQSSKMIAQAYNGTPKYVIGDI